MPSFIKSNKSWFSGIHLEWEFLVGVCRPVLQILTRFQAKKCYFLCPFSDQTSKNHTF